MRSSAAAAALLLLGCSATTEPEAERVLGTIVGFGTDDPQIETTVVGRAVTVRVSTYGSGCFTSAGTEVSVAGLEATIRPYDRDPGCATRDLRVIDHTATVAFEESGTARIRVVGLDGSHAVTPPDTVAFERAVAVP